MVEICGAITVSAYSSTVEGGNVVEFSDNLQDRLVRRIQLVHRRRIRHARRQLAGHRRDGVLHVRGGRIDVAIERKLKVMMDLPRWLDDVMLSRPAMVENCRSSGAATDDAMVSGLAPGKVGLHLMVGKSIFGRSFTGSDR